MILNTSNKKFGYFFSTLFIIAFLFFLIFNNYYFIFLYLSFGTILLTIFLPGWLYPFNLIWQIFGNFLHFLTSKLIITIFYFFIITPLGLLLKLFGYDPFLLKKNQDSYWVKRGKQIESYEEMF